jgi:uncharacterized Zn-binding protein involved in type VI secretion
MTRAQGSANVYVNSIKWSCQGHLNTSHLLPPPPCPSHRAPIAKGSRSVFVNGRGAGRVGDNITGCTSVAAGSSNVFVGDSGGGGAGTEVEAKPTASPTTTSKPNVTGV